MERKLNDLTEDEKSVFQKIAETDYDGIRRLITEGKVRISCIDNQGMSLLHHAAFKGNRELCQLFLDSGADINSTNHEHKYTALMCGALSGNAEIVSLLLENGADRSPVNSINRTATQMAAFVGQHHIVSIINNYVPKEDVDYYTYMQKNEKEPRLPITLAKPLHKLLVTTNIHPVHIALHLQCNPPLLDEVKKVSEVLNDLSIKHLNNNNEILSMKVHHITFVVKLCNNYINQQSQKAESDDAKKTKEELLEQLMKCWLKGGKENGFSLALEKIFRQSIRDYPFGKCTLFQQYVRTLSKVELGSEPTAMGLLIEAVAGHRNPVDYPPCVACGEVKATKKCSACKYVQYCDKRCQKLHWSSHKTLCPSLKKKYIVDRKRESEKSSIDKSQNTEIPHDKDKSEIVP